MPKVVEPQNCIQCGRFAERTFQTETQETTVRCHICGFFGEKVLVEQSEVPSYLEKGYVEIESAMSDLACVSISVKGYGTIHEEDVVHTFNSAFLPEIEDEIYTNENIVFAAKWDNEKRDILVLKGEEPKEWSI